ncbi:aminotransferase class V-fold PLP-dependent enzyme [Alkalimarinus alittae]|uniref:Aminotransferase class V-fold PLP-dependent enzyme n=1 Tax=Alkalimarinus alittae TaxID=2961619 RepID=A0ABY6MXD2_9ALTE|nr:aminotransferase class V-fold PLP-dependent enzyme [Alkalimarinus alittae]UZE94457.1 aminotransferase class V-fold PLP-dependent enzyme [Alkalimarinus alittae]
MNDEFPLHADICYLNHAAVSPWPKRTQNAVSKFAAQNTEYGATYYLDWLKVEASLRQRLANLIGSPSSADIALSKSTSEALSIIAYGLEWSEGDEIIISNQEFPSNRIVWESLASKGVKLRIADIDDIEHQDAVEAIAAEINENTKLISISSVQYASGLKVDINRLGKICHSKDILYCIDAIQSLGAIDFDINKNHADFVVADGHKWMMGPEGLALLYVKPTIRDTLSIQQYGWHMVEHRGDYTRKTWEPASDATRFECGSPNMLGIHALNASLSLIEDMGIKTIEQQLQSNIAYLIEQLKTLPNVEILSPIKEADRAGIVTFKIAGVDSNKLYSELMQQSVICACRGGGVRFSPHFYTQKHVIDNAIKKVKSLTHT